MAINYEPTSDDALEDEYEGVDFDDPGESPLVHSPGFVSSLHFFKPVQDEILALIKGSVASKGYRQTYTCGTGDAVGEPVRISGNNTVTQALATTAANAKVVGFVRSKPTTTTCHISHYLYVSGLSGLTAGSPVYLTDAGSYSASAGTVAKVVGVASSTTEALLVADGLWANLASLFFNDAEGDPANIGTAADGTSNFVARRDHVHAIPNDHISDAMLRESAALSVIGRSANSTGNPADIAAANDGEALMRIGTAVGFNNHSALTEIDLALDDVIPLSDASDSNKNKKLSANRLLGYGLQGIVQGRLTLTSGVPVTTTDVTGATTIYFTPYKGNRISLYDGTRWKLYALTEISLALGTLSDDLPYDVFIYDNAGTLTLVFVAWSTGTTRATALATQDGVLVQDGTPARRYLGTFRTETTTTVDDSVARRTLINYYNKQPRPFRAIDTTDSWTSMASAFEPWNGGTTAGTGRVNILCPIGDEAVEALFLASALNSTGTTGIAIGIGLDSTTVNSAGIKNYANHDATGRIMPLSAQYKGYPGIGFHYLQMLQRPQGATATFYGDIGTADLVLSGLQGEIWG